MIERIRRNLDIVFFLGIGCLWATAGLSIAVLFNGFSFAHIAIVFGCLTISLSMFAFAWASKTLDKYQAEHIITTKPAALNIGNLYFEVSSPPTARKITDADRERFNESMKGTGITL